MELEILIKKKYLNDNVKKLSEVYLSNKPFPHIFLKSFFQDDFILNISKIFPDLKNSHSYEKKDINERKFGLRDIYKFPIPIKELIHFLNSDVFLKYLNEITGIKETLIPDPYLYGGGLHQISKGGYLKIHSDFYLHPKMKLDRRLNLLIYLNDNWKEEYGGALELWNQNMTNCEKKIYPYLNNVCIFSTDDRSYHGHPDPLNCPEDVTRNSIALYYYSNGRPDSDKVYKDKNTTNWKNRLNSTEVINNYNLKDFLRRFKIFRNLKKIIKK
jgi:Rps23 Pro-64 3,4-dihydroxylase Tpa1-like proline 4-hydroxylase